MFLIRRPCTRQASRAGHYEKREKLDQTLISARSAILPFDGQETVFPVRIPVSHSLCCETETADSADGFLAVEIRLEFYHSLRNRDLLKSCLQLFETNMGDMYRASSWGLDMKKKRAELRHPEARIIVVRGGANDDILGFAHFRFSYDDDDNPTDALLYVFELQVSERARGCGLGRRLMKYMEEIAIRTGMIKVMLTVFKSNQKALGFYRDVMNFSVDPVSPSCGGEEEEYEIMSKLVS